MKLSEVIEIFDGAFARFRSLRLKKFFQTQ